MKPINFLIGALFFLTSFTYAQQTYKVGNTEYYYNQYYSTTGLPKVKRSEANKQAFLRSKGYSEVPSGYQIDHIVPLSQGGSDTPQNMQLLTVEQHKAKTAKERAYTSSTYYPTTYRVNSTSNYATPSYYTTPSYTLPSTSSNSSSSNRTYYTGSRGGTYYINSNGNKTYVKN